ncbi:MAG: hypothetical protein HPY61_13830 [Methanotrichaceae archaeon]|nr:hypothetical protein [Methanotrichaceae archaeon]
MNGLGQKIRERRARLGLLPALASPCRLRDYEEYLQNPYAPHMNGRCRSPLGFRQFCRASSRLERLQQRLKTLGDADQWETREYKDLEQEETRLCNALGC